MLTDFCDLSSTCDYGLGRQMVIPNGKDLRPKSDSLMYLMCVSLLIIVERRSDCAQQRQSLPGT